jgi:hypothetical protein
MKKKSRIEIAKDIVSRVREELNRPRLTESVRNGLTAQAAPAIEKPAAHSARTRTMLLSVPTQSTPIYSIPYKIGTLGTVH